MQIGPLFVVPKERAKRKAALLAPGSADKGPKKEMYQTGFDSIVRLTYGLAVRLCFGKR